MSNAKTFAAFANLPKVLESAQFLARMGVLRPEDVEKCVRVYVKKHPEINEHFAGTERLERSFEQVGMTRMGRE